MARFIYLRYDYFPKMDRELLSALRLIQWPNYALNNRPTYWQIARYLDVSPKAVRTKFDRLSEIGVLGGINIVPDVTAFGLFRTAIYISAEKTVLERIWNNFSTLDTIMYLHRYGLSTDSLVIEVIHYDEDHLDSQLELISSVFGQINVLGRQRHITENNYKFDAKDLAILRVLVTEPMARLSKISSMTGIGVRTINDRIHDMAFSNAISCEPIFNGYNGVNPLFYIVSINHEDISRKEIKEKALDLLKSSYVSFKENFDRTILILVAVENFQEMLNLYSELKGSLAGCQVTLIHPFESRYSLPRIVKAKLNGNAI